MIRLGRSGSAIVEFAVLAPVFSLVFAGLFDLGNIVYTRQRVNEALNAAANYALVQNAQVADANTGEAPATTLAREIARVGRDAGGAAWATVTATVNNGPVGTASGTTNTVSGSAANADKCYCPPRTAANNKTNNTAFDFGSEAVCGSTTACTGGAFPGKFVYIVSTHNYTPIFLGYGFVRNGTISQSVEVQVQ